MGVQFDLLGANGAGVMRLVGDLNLLTAGVLRDQIRTLVAAGFRQLVVDLAEVKTVDSSGVSALIGGLRATRVAGGDFRIARPADAVRAELRRTRIDAVLTPYMTVEEALAGYR